MMTLLVLILYCRDELDYLLIHYDKVSDDDKPYQLQFS